MKTKLFLFIAFLFSATARSAMPDGYTFYTTTNGVKTAFTALSTAYRCAIGIAWNSTLRTSSSDPYEIGAGIPTDYQGSFIIPSFLSDQAYAVTEIGYKAFYKCKGLTSVYIPNSITYIDFFAFDDCVAIKSVSIPGSVSVIDEMSFGLCSGLESVILNEGINEIGNQAFLACSSLKTIDIPASVTKIGSKAFGGANVTHTGSGYSYEGCDNLTKVIVHWEEPINISSGTFSNAANATLYVPKGSVETYSNATGWKDFKSIVEFSPSIIFADSKAKNICVANWDTDGDGELSENEAAAVTNLDKTFRKSDIQSFNELKYFTGLTSIDTEAFEKCYSLASVRIPQNVKTISSQAFKECTSLAIINIPGSVETISSKAFNDCDALEKVIIEDIAAWCNINCQSNPLAFAHLYSDENAEVKDLEIPNGVTTIRNGAFENCMGLSSVAFSDDVISIGYGAFQGCSDLTSVSIPNSVTSIGNNAFFGCINLTSVNLSNSVTVIENGTFASCTSLTSFAVPNGVKTIRSKAFANCRSLTSITIPASVNCIEGTPFNGCSKLNSIIVDTNNETYKSPTGSIAIIDKATQSLVAGCENTIMPKEVVSIGESAFLACSFSSITIPNSITSIGKSAFANCSFLTTITMSNSVTALGGNAFQGCTSLKKIVLSTSLETIGASAFYGCSNINTITVPSSVSSIAASAFYGCSGLKSVTINGPSSIGNNAFSGCYNLESLVLSNSVTSIGASAFNGCTNLSSIEIPSSVTTIGASAFYGCTGLTSATINGSASIEWQAFYNCKNLQSVILSDGVKTIGNNVFFGCTSLTSIIIPQTVTSIGSAAFSGCNNLLLVVSENDNPSQINDAAFYGINTNARLQVPEGTKSKYEAIAGWKNYFKEIVDDGNTPEVYTLTITVDGLGYVNYDGTSIRNSSSSSYILGGRSALLSFVADNVNGLQSVKVNNVDVTSSVHNNQYSIEAITSNTIIEVKYEYPVLAEGEAFEVDYSFATFRFVVISESDKTCELTTAWCDEDDVDVIVPSTIYGYKVIGIGDYAFSDEDDMETITLPPTITYIGKGAFDDGGDADDVYISDLEAWCNITFANNYSVPAYGYIWLNGRKIIDLVIPDNITKINNYAFYGLTCIQSVDISEGVESIGANAFYNYLSSVTVHSAEPISIESTSFPSRANATLFVPYGSKAAYEAADYWKEFKEIVEMEPPSPNIEFADANVKAVCVTNWDTNEDGELNEDEAAAVTDLGSVFKQNTTITSFDELQYFTGLTSIGSDAFKDCSGLTNIRIPNSVTNIGNGAFEGCRNLTSITFPISVTSLESRLFYSCEHLKNVVLPNSIQSIPANLYLGYTNKPSYGFTSIDGTVENIHVPGSVSWIGIYSINQCDTVVIEDGSTELTLQDRNADDGYWDGALSHVKKLYVGRNMGLNGSSYSGEVFCELNSRFTRLTDVTFGPLVTQAFTGTSFRGCSHVSSVTCLSKEPFSSPTFYQIPQTAVLNVPLGSKQQYEAANGWKQFGDIREVTEVTITLDDTEMVYAGDYDLDFSNVDGLKAYVASDFDIANSTITLDRIQHVSAGKGVILKGAKGTYTVPCTNIEPTAADALCGTISGRFIRNTQDDNINFYFDKVEHVFKPVDTAYGCLISRNGAYLSLPASSVSGNGNIMPVVSEPTDISQIDNVIYIEPMEERTGTEATISFKMKNTAAIRGFQFDLELPEGVAPVEEDGDYVYWLNADRAPKKAGGQFYHTLEVTKQADGTYRFLCGAQQNKTFSGNDGEVAVIKVNIADNMKEGDYPIVLKNIKLTETDISNYYQTAEVVAKLTIVNYIPGDISGDGIVDVSDYIGVANHILGNTPAGFNARAADVNNDNVIDVSDYIGIANIILTGSIYGNNNSRTDSLPKEEEQKNEPQ